MIMIVVTIIVGIIMLRIGPIATMITNDVSSFFLLPLLTMKRFVCYCPIGMDMIDRMTISMVDGQVMASQLGKHVKRCRKKTWFP